MVFIPKKVTFSEEALEMINELRKVGSFRSMSQTLEEIVRRVYYIKQCPSIEAVNIQLKRFGITVNRS